jgi:SAM-dependent methyltransferase
MPESAPTSFLACDAERLCFADAAFDSVYSIGVLHHTPSLSDALDEIHRVLVPGGRLHLMLYRSWTPLWCVLRAVRGALLVPWLGPRLRRRVLESQLGGGAAPDRGTAILELFGCPIIRSYTLRGLRRRFGGRFVLLESECHRVGLEQIARLLPDGLRRWWPQRAFLAVERRLRRWLGFYLVVTAEKLATVAEVSSPARRASRTLAPSP